MSSLPTSRRFLFPQISDEGRSQWILPNNQKWSAMPGRGDGKRNGSEERNGGSQCCPFLSLRERGLSTSLARGSDSFTCIPASTTKSSGLNAPTIAVQPFLEFVESGFSFTHNGGPHQTRQAATGHNALFAQQIHFEVDLSARPIFYF